MFERLCWLHSDVQSLPVLTALEEEGREDAVASSVDAGEVFTDGIQQTGESEVRVDGKSDCPCDLATVGIGVGELDALGKGLHRGRSQIETPLKYQRAFRFSLVIGFVEVDVGPVDGGNHSIIDNQVAARSECQAVVEGELIGAFERSGADAE